MQPPTLQESNLQAAVKFNYAAFCGVYLLSSIGLGGNIPIDATIALEFLPQSRRNLVSLLSMWQPIGVVAASGIAYGTAAKYRCDVSLPSCKPVADGEPCCSVSSNMGWRYEVIILGCITLLVFFVRFFIFPFYESPKFLLSKGREQEAIDVLHKIAKFNKAPPPTLTVEDFAEIDAFPPEYSSAEVSAPPVYTHMQMVGRALRGFIHSFKHLKGLFLNKLQAFTFVLLAIAYMVSQTVKELTLTDRETTGPSTLPDLSSPSSFSATTSTADREQSPTPTGNTYTSTSPVSSARSLLCSLFSSPWSGASGLSSFRRCARDSLWPCTPK